MSLTVNFKTSKGENNTRRFEKSEGVSIYGNLTGVFLPDSNAYVRIDVTDKNGNSFFFDETRTDLLGNYDFWFRTPADDINLNVKVVARNAGGNLQTLNIPIGVGNVASLALPNPPIQFNWLDVLPIALIGLVAIVLIKK